MGEKKKSSGAHGPFHGLAVSFVRATANRIIHELQCREDLSQECEDLSLVDRSRWVE